MVLASLPKTRPTLHTKKRHGQHHKVSKHYSKTYWPYLPMLLIVVLGFMLNTHWSKPGGVLGYATNISTPALLQETNAQRTKQSLGALALNNQLAQAAQAKADDMATKNYWSHNTPEGAEPWKFITNAGYNYSLAGENLAYSFNNSSDVVAGWMNSPTHRENILKAGYKDVGFGIANAPNYQGVGAQTIIVAMYGAPAGYVQAPSPTESQNTSSAQEITPVQTATSNNATPQAVSRFDAWTDGSMPWLLLAAAIVIAIGLISMAVRHGKMWRKKIVKGERFIMKHPLLDLCILAGAVTVILLAQTTGFIN